MNLQQLNYFKTVAECGQVTKASKILHTSQPAVSMSITALEAELEISLFEKKGRLLALTPYGEIFLEHITKALNEIETGRQKIAQIALTNQQTIRIASTYSLSLSLIPTLVKNFTLLYPNTIFHLKQGPNLELLEDLTGGKTDFVFGRVIPGESNYEDIEHLFLYSENLVVLINKGHPLAARKELTMDEIKDENFIFFHESTGYNMIVTKLFESLNIQPQIHYEVYDNSTCAALVSANQGIALVVPSDSYDSHSLRQVKIKVRNHFNETKVCLFYCRQDITPLHQEFLEYIKNQDFNSN